MGNPKFVYRLQRVLEIAVRKEDEEKEKLAKVLQEEEREKQVKVELQQQLAGTINSLRQRQEEKSLDISALQTYPARIKFLENKIISQDLRIREMAIKVSEQRKNLMKAAQERQKYEKHKESSREKWQAEIDAKEATMLDELATLKYARQAPEDELKDFEE